MYSSIEENISPCFTNESSPGFTNESSPGFTNESSPCFTNESSPCFTNESSPGFTSPVQSRFYNMPVRGVRTPLDQSESVRTLRTSRPYVTLFDQSERCVLALLISEGLHSLTPPQQKGSKTSYITTKIT